MRVHHPNDCSTPALVRDNITTHGHAFAAQQARKEGLCFTLFYFAAFGRAPRSDLRALPLPWGFYWDDTPEMCGSIFDLE